MLIDMHCHLIYGVDDGPQTFEQMTDMIELACQNRISHIMSTSHIVPGIEPFNYERYFDNLKKAQNWCKENNLPIQVHQGSEILYTPETQRFLSEGKIPTLAQTKNVLVEFIPQVTFDTLIKAAREIGNTCHTPIFAHIERYKCLRNKKNMQILHDEYQVPLQVNAATITDKQDFFTNRWLSWAIKNDLVDVISSDAHSTKTRKCRMYQSYQIIKDKYGDQAAHDLCINNAAKLLKI